MWKSPLSGVRPWLICCIFIRRSKCTAHHSDARRVSKVFSPTNLRQPRDDDIDYQPVLATQHFLFIARQTQRAVLPLFFRLSFLPRRAVLTCIRTLESTSIWRAGTLSPHLAMADNQEPPNVGMLLSYPNATRSLRRRCRCVTLNCGAL